MVQAVNQVPGNERVELAVRNGWIVDGSGSARFRGDVGIANGRIVAVGRTPMCADDAIDAAGLVVAPGFIDTHVHSELALFTEDGQEASSRQGITTHVLGQDGFGFAPTDDDTFAFMRTYLSGIYGRDVPLVPAGIGAFLASYSGRTTVNVATLVPHGCVRMLVAGNSPRELGPDGLEAALAIIETAMQEGALGLSSGLDYVPSMYGDTSELVECCRGIARHRGLYVSHYRYSMGAGAGLDEAIEIGRRAQVPVHVSHLLGEDDANPGESEHLLSLVDAGLSDGIDITFDAYPYTHGAAPLAIVLPGWVFEGDWATIKARLLDANVRERLRVEVDSERLDWSKARIAGTVGAHYRSALGKDLLTAAAEAHADSMAYVCDLLVEHELAVTLVWTPKSSERAASGLTKLLTHSVHMLCSDGIYAPGLVHPRGYGAFARFVGRLCREGMLSLEQAVRHVTAYPARRFGLGARGLIASGQAADLVVFDPDSLCDEASDSFSRRTASGVKDVIVNGVPVIRDSARTGATPGRALTRDNAVTGGSRS